MEKSLAEFAEILGASRRLVFFGGAGVSTESGLKDYRSEDGIYQTARDYGRPPEEILSHDCLYEEPELFWRFFRDFFFTGAEPNDTHKILAALESDGRRVSVVTQNIDGLHQRAGSTRVYELHGSADRYACIACGMRAPRDEVVSSPANVPKCRRCGAMIRPLVTMYGEMLDDDVVTGAVTEISRADTLIIGGTSLAVYPAASFVRYFHGRNLVMINRDPTPYDHLCTLVFHTRLGDVFRDAAKRLSLSY